MKTEIRIKCLMIQKKKIIWPNLIRSRFLLEKGCRKTPNLSAKPLALLPFFDRLAYSKKAL